MEALSGLLEAPSSLLEAPSGLLGAPSGLLEAPSGLLEASNGLLEALKHSPENPSSLMEAHISLDFPGAQKATLGLQKATWVI